MASPPLESFAAQMGNNEDVIIVEFHHHMIPAIHTNLTPKVILQIGCQFFVTFADRIS